MTTREILTRRAELKKLKDSGARLEALLKFYYLNGDMIRFIATQLLGVKNSEEKLKKVTSLLIRETGRRGDLKKLLPKKDLKLVKEWVTKTEALIKNLKLKIPVSLNALLSEAENSFVTLKFCTNAILPQTPVKSKSSKAS